MLEKFSIKPGSLTGMKTPDINLNDIPTAIASAFEGDAKPEFDRPTYVHLNLEDLKYFEVVERQFEPWGVTFTNAIAINPSNPAFPTNSGNILLLGSPENGSIKATFSRPVSFVCGWVTSSRRTTLTAYDRSGGEIARQQIPEANLAGTNSQIPANALLGVRGSNIHRVAFYAFDGHLTLDDFGFIVAPKTVESLL